MEGRWHFWIDRGGTFTDVVARRPDGRLVTAKLLSVDPARYADAAVAGMRRLLGVADTDPFPADHVAAIKMGTTVATNALLEHAGEPTLLMITHGFGEALTIGQQNRPRLFELNIERPAPLWARVAEVDERVSAHGEVVRPLDEDDCRMALKAAYHAGLRSVAIVFLHGFRFPAHEARAAELAAEAGFTQISASHQVSPLIKLTGRGATTVVDAYLSPVLRRYVDQVARAVAGTRLFFMQSNGGLAAADRFRGKDAILSGPAGGVIGAIETARAAGFNRLIGFDMGGTSTDVSHYDGRLERVGETTVAGVPIKTPMMAVHTVAAGGGSVCWFDGQRQRVGPASAGADPGPAAYGRGGPLTVTDCNVAVGKLQPDLFPAVFGASGGDRIDRDAARDRLGAVAGAIAKATGARPALEEVADGFLRIAVERMARAIKKISVERGHDVTRYCLVCFGGAGGQFACRVADALAIDTVTIHPMSGVLSALGMGLANLRDIRARALDLPLDAAVAAQVTDVVTSLEAEAAEALAEQGVPRATIGVERRLNVRYRGTDTPLTVPYADPAAVRGTFEAAHAQVFGFTDPDGAIVLESAEVEASGGGWRDPVAVTCQPGAHTPLDTRRVFADGGWREATVYRREEMAIDTPVEGPAILVEDHATTVVEDGWQAVRQARGELTLTRARPRPERRAVGTSVDPVLLEVFNNLFMSVAEEMGVVLEKTAHSVNVKERLDFSCAVFDAGGGLVANAPHMPVHLGSMGATVKTVKERNAGRIGPGDVFVVNDPFNGGTHLPDVTVVTPVFLEGDADNEKAGPGFFVASRGHHADIGGLTPGSMPPQSRTVEDEGVLFDNVRLVDGGRLREREIRAALTAARYPARNPDQNIADLKAQIAANETGVRAVLKLVDGFGRDTVAAYMGHVQDNAEESVRRVIDVLSDGDCTYPLDNGATIRVAVRVDRQTRAATIDFTGSSDQLADNFNAPLSVTHAAVLYVFRCLVDDDIPLNDGCLKPITIAVPDGSFLNPRPPAATVAGNVETSQAVTNALFLALGRLAAAQGTMNNITFGTADYQYYETLCGGAGAGPGFNGASAVHTHMTNSRLTDPEVLEWRYPVRVDAFGVRAGSGGDGRWHGGDGAVRRIRFLADMDAAILASHRTVAPPGLAGGRPGAVGRTAIERADGRVEELAAADTAHVRAGDCLVVETPGGGGYGEPDTQD